MGSSSPYADVDFEPLLAQTPDEVVTHALARDVRLPSGRILALITLDNGRDHARPNTIGPHSLRELGERIDELAARTDLAAIAVTGKRFCFAAGADLGLAGDLLDTTTARLMASLGHHVFGKLGTLTSPGVPTFAFLNGLALGGGLELALHCDYRTVDRSAPVFAFPEVFLGLVPGWGGATLVPRLIGIEHALRVIVENPLKNNRMLRAEEFFELGLADALIHPRNFLEDSLSWADRVLGNETRVVRANQPGRVEKAAKWNVAVSIARKLVVGRLHDGAATAERALDLIAHAKSGSLAAGFAREDDVLTELISSETFRASRYAFDLVQKRAKRPVGAPDAALARRIGKVGIIGAGLMATQLAVLFVRRLRVPVVLTDLDQARIDKAVTSVRAEIDGLAAKGRIDADEAARLRALISGSTDRSVFADCDWAIEAVFEDLAVKQRVFAEFEPLLADTAVLATNTSSLSVAAIGAELAHPERLVGFHFFNPVARMPLLEIAPTAHTDAATLATAFAVAATLKKSAVRTADAPGFVVNRLLAKVMGEAARALDAGTPVAVVERSLDPIGLPMGPFALIDLVGWAVAGHVQDSLAAAFPERFYASPTLHALAAVEGPVLVTDAHGAARDFTKAARRAIDIGHEPVSGATILRRVEDELATEIRRMLDEQVVTAPEDIDLCLILGAGWPFRAGGITPYLDRVGASERATGQRFHPA